MTTPAKTGEELAATNGGRFRTGPDPRRNMAGRPKLNADQRKALKEMRSWTPTAIEDLRLRLFGDAERDIKPEKNTYTWLSLWDRWAAYVLGKPGDMLEQCAATPETTADALELRWADMSAADRVKDLEAVMPMIAAALEKARADLADEVRDEPAALLAAEGDAR